MGDSFLLSCGLLVVLAMVLGRLAGYWTLPPLVGYLLAGVCLGGSGLNLLSPLLLEVSSPIRQLALIVILLKAGLSLELSRLKAVGRPALLMAFVPACFEFGAVTLLAPLFFPLTTLDAALLGAVLAAVSPAVVVPRMVAYIERGGKKGNAVAELVLAGASLDDVFVIALFTALLGLAQGGEFSPMLLLDIPISIVTGVVVGFALAYGIKRFPFYFNSSDKQKVLVLLALSALLVGLEASVPFPYAPLLSVMTLAMGLGGTETAPLKEGYNALWVGGEVLLFALVGAEIPVAYGLQAGLPALLLICLALLVRGIGVVLATMGSGLSRKNQLFCVISYLPKATVQAAIGGLPLALGLPCGELILTVAVLAILVTAPLGAFLIDRFGGRLCA